ncbi:MAG: DUF3413 domain-containing protein [Shewanella sp.]
MQDKLSNYGRFVMVNALIAMVIACHYLAYLPQWPAELLAQVFLVSSNISHFMVLTAGLSLMGLPLLLLPARARLLSQALLATLLLTALIIDTFVFAQYRFHINAVVLELVLSGQVVSFPIVMYLATAATIAAIFVAEVLLLKGLAKPQKIRFRILAAIGVVCLLASNGIHIWAAAHGYQPVTVLKRYFPLFYPLTANGLLAKYGLVNADEIAAQKALNIKRQGDLNYPKAPLLLEPIEQPMNIMMIVVDSWRFDTFNAQNTPHMWQFAQQGQNFNQHYATGNSTRTGIFGLFYGVHGTYWHSFLANQTSPLLVDRMQQLGYQTGIFAAAHLRSPEFNETVFSKVNDLRLESDGSRPAELDQDITQDWQAWYGARDVKRPSFSFLFYDAPHGFDMPDDYPLVYEPQASGVNFLALNNSSDPKPLINRYKNSVHYVDSLVQQVLTTLERSGDLANTLVIITGDHGQEINDNGLNFWGHNSNFTSVQVHVPFVVVAPNISADKFWPADTVTTHLDVAPTLAKHFLGVQNPVSDFAQGADLLGPVVERPFVMASSYSSYAIMTPDRILEVGAGGQMQLLDNHNRPVPNEKLQPEYLQQALAELRSFYL